MENFFSFHKENIQNVGIQSPQFANIINHGTSPGPEDNSFHASQVTYSRPEKIIFSLQNRPEPKPQLQEASRFALKTKTNNYVSAQAQPVSIGGSYSYQSDKFQMSTDPKSRIRNIYRYYYSDYDETQDTYPSVNMSFDMANYLIKAHESKITPKRHEIVKSIDDARKILPIIKPEIKGNLINQQPPLHDKNLESLLSNLPQSNISKLRSSINDEKKTKITRTPPKRLKLPGEIAFEKEKSLKNKQIQSLCDVKNH